MKLHSILFLLLLSGCSSSEFVYHPHKTNAKNIQPKKIAVFFDGTSNTANSATNVVKLYNLVTLQPRADIHSIYIKGVGTEGGGFKQVVGMATGYGIGEDVRQAYHYLSSVYSPNDEIYLFGFSRGAYSARILAGMIFTAGLVDINNLKNKDEQIKLIEKIYDEYKGDRPLKERQDSIARMNLVVSQPRIKFMGIWDTVEALGLPNRSEKIENVNSRYIDQLCNIDKAAHALSVDDNRAKIFTPISLTSKDLVKHCNTVSIDSLVNEVWFAGAHADVGGGYEDTELSGVSLNWMIEQLDSSGIIPEGVRVLEDPLGKSHNPSTGFFGLIYENRNRNLPHYIKHTGYNKGKIKIHESVFERLKVVPKQWQEFDWIAEGSEKYTRNFPDCFDKVVDKDNSLYTLTLLDQSCFFIEKRSSKN
ncbi:T6SS phospholipase effector Tle1-like catalytic domain-containing protein [Catenovulum agarivorans]|uniref:phospholipase effector Tle1 domain-containing protein n=1 Tax=Catenovulum agarivorans TaxID=1172192 RepID=UPI0002F3DC00|nr:DUF2235 domain-containing protein [Catenovulum agarivorans]